MRCIVFYLCSVDVIICVYLGLMFWVSGGVAFFFIGFFIWFFAEKLRYFFERGPRLFEPPTSDLVVTYFL